MMAGEGGKWYAAKMCRINLVKCLTGEMVKELSFHENDTHVMLVVAFDC